MQNTACLSSPELHLAFDLGAHEFLGDYMVCWNDSRARLHGRILFRLARSDWVCA